MVTDSTFWRSLRSDFESLQPEQFSLIWYSRLPTKFSPLEPLQGQWRWYQFPNESLRARLTAIALRGAKALGHDSEDGWFDELREADFVKFEFTGETPEKQPDGSQVILRSGTLDDVLKQSITLCHVLETGGAESLPKRSRRGTRTAQSGFPNSGPPYPDSPTAVDDGMEAAIDASSSPMSALESAPLLALKTGKKPGRRPNQERRNAIRTAIRARGDNWREQLCDIFAELDSQNVPLGDFQSMKIDLGDGKSAPVSTWSDLDLADGQQLRQIVDVLRKYAR